MYIIFDIGGTQTRVASSSERTDLEDVTSFPTPQNPEEGIAQIVDVAKSLAGEEKVTHCAGGIAGPLDRGVGGLAKSPNLPDWIGVPVSQKLAEGLEIDEVLIENDTALVGLGEATAGAGTDFDIMAYITVSTGVGGVRIVNKEVDENSLGFEPGHHIVDMGEYANHDTEEHLPGDVPGTWEYFISGTGIGKRHGEEPAQIVDQAVWEQFRDELVYGLNNVSVFWSPEAIILGGSMIIRNEHISIGDIRDRLGQTLQIFEDTPHIKVATLGDKGGLYGALHLLRQKN